MGRFRSSLIVAVVVLTGACGGSDKVEAPEPTVPTAPSTTTIAATGTTATTVASFATPDTIDAPYVERVLVELNRVYGDTARKIVETNRYERSDIDPLGAIFNPPLLELQVNEFSNIIDLDPKMFKSPMGYRRMTVLEVVTARPDCIFAKINIDVSEVLVSPPPIKEKYVTLDPKPPGADPRAINPTPWSMAGESTARQDPCAG